MKVSEKMYRFLEQFLRCLIYVGIGHTAFEVVTIWRTPEVSDFWYYGLAVPGLYYLVAVIVLTMFIMFVKK